jgi:hypothetical protein
MVVRHPLGKLTYAFDRKNSEKIKGWLKIDRGTLKAAPAMLVGS